MVTSGFCILPARIPECTVNPYFLNNIPFFIDLTSNRRKNLQKTGISASRRRQCGTGNGCRCADLPAIRGKRLQPEPDAGAVCRNFPAVGVNPGSAEHLRRDAEHHAAAHSGDLDEAVALQRDHRVDRFVVNDRITGQPRFPVNRLRKEPVRFGAPEMRRQIEVEKRHPVDETSGRLNWIKNPLGKYTRYAYNTRNQIVRIWGEAEYPLEFTCNQYGEQTRLQTCRSGDFSGAVWPELNVSGDMTTWVYDAASGNVTAKIDAKGKETQYTHTTKMASGLPGNERVWSTSNLQLCHNIAGTEQVPEEMEFHSSKKQSAGHISAMKCAS